MKGGITSGIVYPNAALALARGLPGSRISAARRPERSQLRLVRRPRSRSAEADEGGRSLNQRSTSVSKALRRHRRTSPLPASSTASSSLRRRRSGSPFARHTRGNAGVPRKGLALLGSGRAHRTRRNAASARGPHGSCLCCRGANRHDGGGSTGCGLRLSGRAVFSVLRIARVLRRNLMGLCTGTAPDQPARPGKMVLTDWLHETLQALSGKGFGPAPHLRRSLDGGALPRRTGLRPGVTLKMITTGISHQEPRSLPFESALFWFRRTEFEALFPKGRR